MLNMAQPEEAQLPHRSKMPYRYFVKCITQECIIRGGISQENITSSDKFDFFNVLVRVKSERANGFIKYWESEGLNVISFRNEEDDTDKDLRILLLTIVPSDQAKHEMTVEYSLGDHGYS